MAQRERPGKQERRTRTGFLSYLFLRCTVGLEQQSRRIGRRLGA